jgi:putative transposase
MRHVIIRGIERKKIFWGDPDRADFLDRLETLLPKTKTAFYAWASIRILSPRELWNSTA